MGAVSREHEPNGPRHLGRAVWRDRFHGISARRCDVVVHWRRPLDRDLEQQLAAGHRADAAGTRSVLCAAFSPNSRILAVGSSTVPVALLDLNSRQWHNLSDANGSTAGATCLAFTPDGTTCAIAEQGGRIALWDVANDRRLATLGEHPDFVGELVFAPDGQTLATSGHDRRVRIWDVRYAGNDSRFRVRRSSAASLVFSPDGRWLLVGDELQPVIRIWDMDTLSECATLTGRTGVITTLAISPDGCTLAAANHQGWVSFWNLRTLELRPKRLQHAGVSALAFAPNGRTLATGGLDGAIHLWDWPISDGR